MIREFLQAVDRSIVAILTILRSYLTEDVVHAEVVVEVAVIAIARRAIILDTKQDSPVAMVGVAAIIVALAAGMSALRRWRAGRPGEGGRKPEAGVTADEERAAQGGRHRKSHVMMLGALPPAGLAGADTGRRGPTAPVGRRRRSTRRRTPWIEATWPR